MSDTIPIIISRSRTTGGEDDKLTDAILNALKSRDGVKPTLVPHLYDLTSDGPGMKLLKSIPGDMIVAAWLYPRASYWLLSANEIQGRLGRTFSLPEEDVQQPADTADADQDLPNRTIWCLDLRARHEVELYLDEIDRSVAASAGPVADSAAAADQPATVQESTGSRWYPVIDYNRCTNCLECLNFCLFGVYGLDRSDSILIEQPDACRAGCPACSRICPEGAIMFPQHKDPAIAGDPKSSLGGLKLDLSQLFGGAMPADIAVAERDRALAEQHQAQGQPAAKDKLDHLVDELDDLDL